MVWYQVQRPRLDVFVHRPRHARQIEIVKMACRVFKANVKLVVQSIVNVTAMNVVTVVFVNRCADEMMIVAMEECAKTLFARLDVDQMLIVQVIWHVLPKNVLIHALNQLPADQMPTASFKIT